jgi:hypothetical protein
MVGAVVLPAAVKAALVGLLAVVAVGLTAAVAASLLRAADRAEAESRGDRPSRQRALDELVGLGSLDPEDYAERQAALSRER